MAHSGRGRHRDREPGSRNFDEEPPARTDRVFRISDEQRQMVARHLRLIDQARRALQDQQNPANREIIRELKASADRIFDVLNDLDEID